MNWVYRYGRNVCATGEKHLLLLHGFLHTREKRKYIIKNELGLGALEYLAKSMLMHTELGTEINLQHIPHTV